jgi:hypothetical protein
LIGLESIFIFGRNFIWHSIEEGNFEKKNWGEGEGEILFAHIEMSKLLKP